MARATFGGTAADYVVTTGADGLLRLSSATLTMWTAATGGTQITDLLLGGSPVTSVPVGADGSVPTFQGPDGVTELWADAGHGRVRLTAPVTVVDSAVAALASSTSSATAAALSSAITQATVNSRAAGDFAALDTAFGPRGANYLWRSLNDYTFLTDIGGGQFSAFFLPRRSAVFSSTTYTINALTGCAIMRPMISVDGVAATFAGSGTWTTVSSDNPDGSSATVSAKGRMYGIRPLTVSTTASSTTAQMTAGGPLVTSDIGRRIRIPGAGASGADLYTQIIGVNTSTGAMTLGSAASATLSNVASTIHPDYKHNPTAGATATWTTPASATAVGVGVTLAVNGGLAKVTLSGATAGVVDAAGLPTAQEVVDAGRYANTILTTNGGTLAPTDRVLDCFENANGRYGYTRMVAAGLTPDTYTVVATATGYTAVGGSGSRLSIDRFGYALATTSATTAGVDWFIHYDLSDNFDSAWEYAIECKPTSGATWTFIGQLIHGYDNQQTLTAAVDGGAGPADGQTVAAGTVKITRTSKLYHPDSGAALASAPLANATVVYTLDRNGFSVAPDIVFAQQTDIRTAYLMLPLAPRVGTGGKVKIDKAALSSYAGDLTMTGSNNRLGISQSAIGWAWNSTGKVGAAVYVPDFYGFTQGYAEPGITLDGSQVEDRNTTGLPTTKFYFPWVGVNRTRTVPAGWEKKYAARFRVGYFAGGAASSLASA